MASSLSRLSHVYDAKLRKQREDGYHRDFIARHLKEDNLAAISHGFDKNNDLKHGGQEYASVFTTMDAEEKKERLRGFIMDTETEDKWASPPVDAAEEYERDQRTLYKLVQNSLELRDLKAKLQVAEMNMQRFQQLQEKQVLAVEQHSRDAVFHKLMEEKCSKAEREEQLRLLKQHKMKVEAKNKLEEQLQEKEARKQAEQEARAQEKFDMDMIISNERLALHRESVMKSKRQAETKEFMERFERQRAKQKEKEKWDEMRKERERALYEAELERRISEKQAREKEKKEENERIHAILFADKERDAHEKEKFEAVLNDLYFEESEARYLKQAEEQRVQREHVKENLKAASEIHQCLKEQQRKKEKAERERFHKEMMEKLAQESRLEQMSLQKQRMKVEEFKREIEKQWDIKKAAFEEQVGEAIEQKRKEDEVEARKNALIEAERQRLLATHGKRLAKFLPKGTLQKPEDFKTVGIKP